MITKIAGTTFNKLNRPIGVDDVVTVVRERDNPHDNDSQPAYAVMLGNQRMGYIPAIETVKKKMLDAKYDKNRKAYERYFDEVNLLIGLRDFLYTDIEINDIIPSGRVVSVRYYDEVIGWNDHGAGEQRGYSVEFDYE